jgi:hypothetical protein
MLRLLWQEAQTAAVALLVAVLIWVVADNANVKPDHVSANVQLVSPPGTTLLIEPPLVPVTISFEATAAQAQEMHALAAQSPSLRLQVPDAIPGHPNQTIDLWDGLSKLPVITTLGVTVRDVSPARAEAVRVENLVRRDLPVVVSAGDLELAGPPVSSVKLVAMQLPESVLPLVERKKIELVADLQAQVHPRGSPAAPLLENVEQSVEVPLVLTPQWEPVDDITRSLLLACKPSPASTTITFTLRHKREALPHWPVPVVLGLPPAEMDRVAIKLTDPRALITADIEGPTDAIDQIRKGTLQVSALLNLKFQDIEGQTKGSKAVEWRTPADVTVLSPTPPPMVDYTITERRRDPTPAPAPAPTTP